MQCGVSCVVYVKAYVPLCMCGTGCGWAMRWSRESGLACLLLRGAEWEHSIAYSDDDSSRRKKCTNNIHSLNSQISIQIPRFGFRIWIPEKRECVCNVCIWCMEYGTRPTDCTGYGCGHGQGLLHCTGRRSIDYTYNLKNTPKPWLICKKVNAGSWEG